jgi:hypothetical protein
MKSSKSNGAELLIEGEFAGFTGDGLQFDLQESLPADESGNSMRRQASLLAQTHSFKQINIPRIGPQAVETGINLQVCQ